jgi:FKBP-type peptidyl-prolyl cis-trans isomerase FkpA
MRTHWILCGALLLTACHRRRGGVATGRGGAPVTLRTDDDRVLYTIGTILADNLRRSGVRLNRAETAIVQRGLADRMAGGTLMADPQRYRMQVQMFAQSRAMAAQQQTRREGTEFADRAAAETGAVRLPSGVIYRELSAGSGAQPGPTDSVTVNYRGTLPDGTEFDNSQRTGRPATLQLGGGVIPCWSQAIPRMHVGGRARLVCPPDTAYGNRPMPGLPPGSTLNFEVELVGVTPAAGATSEPTISGGGASSPSGTSGSGTSGSSTGAGGSAPAASNPGGAEHGGAEHGGAEHPSGGADHPSGGAEHGGGASNAGGASGAGHTNSGAEHGGGASGAGHTSSGPEHGGGAGGAPASSTTGGESRP